MEYNSWPTEPWSWDSAPVFEELRHAISEREQGIPRSAQRFAEGRNRFAAADREGRRPAPLATGGRRGGRGLCVRQRARQGQAVAALRAWSDAGRLQLHVRAEDAKGLPDVHSDARRPERQ